MNSVPPRCVKPRSSTESTRRPRLTFARIGLSATSNASSVTERSVTRTGHDALLAPDEERQRRLERQHLEHARAPRARRSPAGRRRAGGRATRARRAAGWMPSVDRVRVRVRDRPSRSVASISASSLIVSTRGALQPQRLGAVAGLARRLHLQRPRQRVGVVLQRDHAQHASGVRIDLHDPALEQARRSREAARHGSLRKFFLYSGLSGK